VAGYQSQFDLELLLNVAFAWNRAESLELVVQNLYVYIVGQTQDFALVVALNLKWSIKSMLK
jgi:hypothetical protein